MSDRQAAGAWRSKQRRKPTQIGDPIARSDGRAKLTGSARYTVKLLVAGLSDAVMVTSENRAGESHRIISAGAMDSRMAAVKEPVDRL